LINMNANKIKNMQFSFGDGFLCVWNFLTPILALVAMRQLPRVWTNHSVDGNWLNLKQYVAIDPCTGVQAPNTFAWLLVDPFNLTLVSDIAISSYPLRILKPNVAINADASACLHLSTPLIGAPKQCEQYFQFDFTGVPTSIAGYSWGFTIESTNGNPLPFSSAVVAGGPSCPSTGKIDDETSWLQFHLDPHAPGNAPNKITVTSLMIGTHIQKWWILLMVPEEGIQTPTPFSITAHFNTIKPEPPTLPPTTTTPPTAPLHPPTTAPAQGSPKPARSKKPLPLWAIVVISLTCIALAAGALVWAWRLTREKPSSDSYEIY
jgi:hypothetical protein